MSERHNFAAILKGPKSDRLVLILTFLLTVLIDLTVAVEVGIVLSALLFIRRMAEIANVSAITDAVILDADTLDDPELLSLGEIPAGIEVYEVEGPFFFGMADTFWNALGQMKKGIPVLILRIRRVPVIDATGLNNLRQLHKQCRKHTTQLIFSGVTEQPMTVFAQSRFLKEVGPENFCTSLEEAVQRAERVMKEK